MRALFLSNANSLHLREWSEYFARELGHEIAVMTIPRLEKPYDESVETIEIGTPLTSRKAFWPLLLPRIRREIRARRPDVFAGYRVVSYGFLASLARFRPLVLAAQGGDMVWPPDDRMGRICCRFACRRGDHFNAWASNIRDEMIRYGADPAKIVVLSRGIDLDAFPRLPEKPAGPPTIVMTRSLLPSYNTTQLVAAMPLVLREVPDALCRIAGDGPLRGELEAQAKDLGVADRVRFLGRQSRAEIIRLVEEGHVYASMTITDGLPLSHFEAMAVGCFPVVTDISANRIWFEDGVNGMLAPVGDPPALAKKLIAALQDRDLRERAAKANRAMIERDHDRRVNLRKMAEGWEALARRFRA